ncbi:MAG TPA: hypothetical protein VFB62_26700 [Polyangiaceae bacterium]|nr:hypothetical protein [Polyangiaceae bacterium]
MSEYVIEMPAGASAARRWLMHAPAERIAEMLEHVQARDDLPPQARARLAETIAALRGPR